MNLKLKSKIVEVYGSQADFAQAVKIPEPRISQFVRNRRRPNTEEAEKISRVLGLPAEKLFSAA